MDVKHYAYLPSAMMHEFEHVLGIPDAHDLHNPEQYEGNLMHWSKDDWDDELKECSDGSSNYCLEEEFTDGENGDSGLVGGIY